MKWHSSEVVEITCKEKNKIQDLKSMLDTIDEIKFYLPFYTDLKGTDMGVSDEILIAFKPGVSKVAQNRLHKKFKAEVVKTTKIYQKLAVSLDIGAIKTANQYYETGLVKFAQPNFFTSPIEFSVIPNDAYFCKQVALHNTGQVFTDGHSGANDADNDAPEAWEITTGSSDIIVAVLDYGVTSNHPDLPNSRQLRLAGSDFYSNDNDPSPVGNDNHGNACAGVIAASMNNNEGIAGIAPNCKIMPIRMLSSDGYLQEDKIADAIEFAVDNSVDILSNSWGYYENYFHVIDEALQYASEQNCVIVFAAGNFSNHVNNINEPIAFPAWLNIPGLISVGASDRYDHQANYSPTDSQLDVVAPSSLAIPGQIVGESSEMWSIDIPGSTGYNIARDNLPTSGVNYLAYTGRFGGTSHSCPVVAGIATLVLSVNPNLSNTEVSDIIKNTAEKVGGYNYYNGYCPEMGYGRVNANCAVQYTLAAFSSISGPSLVCASGSSFTINNLPIGTTIEWNKSSNLNRDSEQGSHPCSFSSNNSGLGWIEAKIVTACGNKYTLPRKTVWVGTPIISSISGSTSTPNNQWATYHANLQSTLSAPTDYTWILNPLNGNSVYDYGMSCDIAFYNTGSYQLVAQAQNVCGTGPYYVTGVYVYDTYSLMISPNPSTGETVLSIESTSEEKAFDVDAEWEYEVYSDQQLLMQKQISVKGASSTINTSDWKDGVYFIRVIYKGEILQGKLVVKH